MEEGNGIRTYNFKSKKEVYREEEKEVYKEEEKEAYKTEDVYK